MAIISNGALLLENGKIFEGKLVGSERPIVGEVVFNTSMVGYPEALTDPSYKGQVLVLTYPLIGNYGVPARKFDKNGILEEFESDKVQIAGLVISDYSHEYNHWNSDCSLSDWLKAHDIPCLYGVDTRAITKVLRKHGVMAGSIVTEKCDRKNVVFKNPLDDNLVKEVSHKEIREFNVGGSPKVVAVDCGMKNNIIRYFIKKGAHLISVPWDYNFHDDPKTANYDGLFLSNGPGDPTLCHPTIENIRRAFTKGKPIFGICLGNQLMGLAAGATTYKLPFGHRSQNQPCIDKTTGRVYITPQNHSFAISKESLPSSWQIYFENANDGSIEGIIHREKPFFGIQFHPEAKGGPTDTEFLFDHFLNSIKTGKNVFQLQNNIGPYKTVREKVKKVLIVGSGGLSIGQAGEFDYSGSQCIKALKEEGIKTVLINPNIATIQTSHELADEVYFLPINAFYVEEIIKKESPDAILVTFGGQTALNTGIELYKNGIFEKYGVKVLGTPIDTIIATEDRDLFAKKLQEIDVKIAPSLAADTIDDALKAAKKIGYPVIIRAAFALGGLGSGFADNEKELTELCHKAFANSTQVLVEKSLKGWKEIEYEVVRDAYDNTITVCNMENFDPLGIHTGDSIVVAPSQTLSNEEYHMLRSIAIKTVRHLGVVGECNIQYALDPTSEKYFVIEVNARLSRSSALASKATGYPLAFVAAKLALGYPLSEVPNSVTKVTKASFEPALDYVVVKFPRWDLNKFPKVSRLLGSSMKSVGEVMAIGRKFEEALMKAMRMVDPSFEDLSKFLTFKNYEEELSYPSDRRIFAIFKAFSEKMSIEKINDLTKIDNWFLHKLHNIYKTSIELAHTNLKNLSREDFYAAKKLGISDAQIASLTKSSFNDVRHERQRLSILPVVKQIDTLAAEYPAKTNYLYLTYNGTENDVSADRDSVIILGSGAYRIGSSVEFDWCAVNATRTVRKEGKKAIMINYNPETVSTDYDECDKLYFEEISLESVLDIYEYEEASGAIVSVGGQTPNTIATKLFANGVKILGTSPVNIDMAEDRFKFSKLLDSIGIKQPEWKELTSFEAAVEFCAEVDYPVLIRPSYVLSGQAMNVAHNESDLKKFLTEASEISNEHPVVISKFITGAKEIEFDAVSDRGEILAYAISEHVENAGVHSGDATLVLPPQKLYIETIRKLKKIGRAISSALQITGPFNIQFIAKDNELKVIECNLRASRTFPFVSKVYDINFIEIATKAMLGKRPPKIEKSVFDLDYVAVKAPQFSFTRLHGADPILGVEMASTGEVASFGDDLEEAFLKALLSTHFKLPKKSVLLSTGPLADKVAFLESTKVLKELGLVLYATPGTADFLTEHGIDSIKLHFPLDEIKPNVVDYLREKKIDLVINIPKNFEKDELTNGYIIRRAAVDFAIPLITNSQVARLFVRSLEKQDQVQKASTWRSFIEG